MTTTRPTEIGELAAAAIAEIVGRATGGVPVAEYAEGEPLTWPTLDEGGWDVVGVPEGQGGGGATLRDLVEVAQAWGGGCIPLPLLESIWAKRWSSAARDHGGPISISVLRAGSPDATGLAPFGVLHGIALARMVGTGGDILDKSGSSVAEPFAPSLRAAIVPWVSVVSHDAALELGVLWAAESVGAAQRLVDLSVRYAKDRVQFGRPIGTFQAVKHRLADMHSQVQYAESAVIWASVDSQNAARACRYALDSAIGVAESAIQVHGGMGFTWEMGLHFYLRSMLTRRELMRGLWA